MSGHTPGPWAYEYENADYSGGGCWYAIKGPDGGDLLWYPYNGPRSGGEREEANARLMAAAPELLGQHEADMVDLDLLAEAIHAGDPMPELVIRIADMLNRKIDVIRKATGASA